MSGQGIICPEKPRQCELCGVVAECRPYGPKGEQVCIDCAMKDEAALERGMERYVFSGNPNLKVLADLLRKKDS